MTSKVTVTCTVNGAATTLNCYPMARLLDVLREELGLKGTKEGCGEGECGACAVLLGGELVTSCLVPAVQAQGQEVTTIEGLTGRDGKLHPVQQAFVDCGGAQCGICTPGMIMATVELLKRCPKPTDLEIRDGLAGNLCRCTGYMKIFDAVRHAAKEGTP